MFDGFDAETMGKRVSDQMATIVADLTDRMDENLTPAVVAASYSVVTAVVCEMAEDAGFQAILQGADASQVSGKVGFIVNLLTAVNLAASMAANEYLHGDN